MKKRISQSQIAKELGVSQSLVSLVLNGRRESVSDESYNRIWQLAGEKGYSPRGMEPNRAPDIRRNYVGIVLRAGLKLATQSNTFSHVQQGLFTILQQSHISTTFLGGEGDLDEKTLFELLRQELMADWRSKIAGLLGKPAFRRVYRQFDPFEVGGVPLLGVNGVVIIGHGRSNAYAIKNAIGQARRAVQGDIAETIREGLRETAEKTQ
jgi:transcriptional regulator with XRE-family HTH domain